MFNWFSLDFIYYPVSAIMWVWYKAFAFLLGPTNFFAWALSVMFLVFTLRAILYKPFVRQIRTTRQMQELQPQIKALQKKYGKDRQTMAKEMQKLQSEHGFNPILGCLPMLAQIPVFLGLFHVLRSFNRTQGGFGQIQLSVAQNKATGNYVFSPTDVSNFLDAHLFGAPLGATMIQTTGIDAFTEFNRYAVIGVGVPIMILAGIATYFNSRASVARQSPEAAANPQTALMNKLALYVFPFGVVAGGPFLPLAIILYWLANNIWTFGQQHIVFGRIEKEEEQKAADERAAEEERRVKYAPRTGTKRKWANNFDPSAEFRKATALAAEGKTVLAGNAMVSVWEYLQTSGKRPARSTGGDDVLAGGLLAEVAVALAPALQRDGRWEQAGRVYDGAAAAVKSGFDDPPTASQLGMYLLHRAGSLNALLATKKWQRAVDQGTDDMKWLDQWEALDGGPESRINRFLWNYRVATALYQLKKFDDARARAHEALSLMDEWSDELRAGRRSIHRTPDGYVPSTDFDTALMLLISAAKSEAAGSVKQRLRAKSDTESRAADAARAVKLLAGELQAVEEFPGRTDGDVEFVRAYYRGALQQVASLYLKSVPADVVAEVAFAGELPADVDLLSKALDDHADRQLADPAEALDPSGESVGVTLNKSGAVNGSTPKTAGTPGQSKTRPNGSKSRAQRSSSSKPKRGKS